MDGRHNPTSLGWNQSPPLGPSLLQPMGGRTLPQPIGGRRESARVGSARELLNLTSASSTTTATTFPTNPRETQQNGMCRRVHPSVRLFMPHPVMPHHAYISSHPIRITPPLIGHRHQEQARQEQEPHRAQERGCVRASVGEGTAVSGGGSDGVSAVCLCSLCYFTMNVYLCVCHLNLYLYHYVYLYQFAHIVHRTHYVHCATLRLHCATRASRSAHCASLIALPLLGPPHRVLLQQGHPQASVHVAHQPPAHVHRPRHALHEVAHWKGGRRRGNGHG